MSAVAPSAGLARADAPLSAVIAAAALVAGLADAALVLSSDHFPDRMVWAVFGTAVGWSFVGTGLYAWRRRPESRFGVLMTLLGFAWFLAPFSAANDSLLFTLGFVVGSLWGAVLAHVLLSFPSGPARIGEPPRARDRGLRARAARPRAGDARARGPRPHRLRGPVPARICCSSRATWSSARPCSRRARPS